MPLVQKPITLPALAFFLFATVLRSPAQLEDEDGKPVQVSGRGTTTTRPARMSVEGGPWAQVRRWAGPWTVEESWWDPISHRRRARLQVVLADGSAHLLVREKGSWEVAATYD